MGLSEFGFCREAAEFIRRSISDDAVTPSHALEETYDKLVLWILFLNLEMHRYRHNTLHPVTVYYLAHSHK